MAAATKKAGPVKGQAGVELQRGERPLAEEDVGDESSRDRAKREPGRLRRFGRGFAFGEAGLEGEPDPLCQHRRRLGHVSAGSLDPDRVVAAHPAVAPEIALLLVQRPQPLHGPQP
jgi:hypothetical protein